MIPQPDVKITELLKPGHFTLSAEIIPPRNGASPASILDQIEKLTTSGTHFLAVTKGAGGSLRGGSLPIAQIIKENFGVPCIAHFTCRDLLPEEVENQLIDHHYFGIRNILALRGDPPTGVADWQPKPGSHPYAYLLVEQIKALNAGRYLERSGFKTAQVDPTDFCIGVAVYPDHPDLKEQIGFFKRKLDAGAEYAITQMLFDPDSYARFLDESAKAGIHIPVLPGARLVRTQKQARTMAQRFQIKVPEAFLKRLPEDDTGSSPERTLEAFFYLVDQLKTKGAPGMHVFVLSDTELAKEALRELAPHAKLTGSAQEALAARREVRRG